MDPLSQQIIMAALSGQSGGQAGQAQAPVQPPWGQLAALALSHPTQGAPGQPNLQPGGAWHNFAPRPPLLGAV